MFCVECGAEGEVYDGLCRDCFIKKKRFVRVPENIKVQLCAHCGAMRMGERWEQVDDIVKEALEGAMEVDEEEEDVTVSWYPEISMEDEKNYRIEVHLEISTRGLEIHDVLRTRIRLTSGTCKRCSRQRGSYYEAIVQIRAEGREPRKEEIDGSLRMAGDVVTSSNSFISKIEEVRGGVDIYLGKTSDGREIANTLAARTGATLTETKSQAGRKDGRDIFRSTFLVRLPRFRKGDFLVTDEVVLEIRSISKRNVVLENISTGEKDKRRISDIRDLEVLVREDHLRRAVVVADEDEDLQLMHPDSYRTVDVRKTSLYSQGQDEIPVVLWKDDLFPYLLDR